MVNPGPARDVGPEHARLDRLHVTPHVRLGIKDVAVVRCLVKNGLVLVGEDYVGPEGLHAQQGLAQRARALAEDLVLRFNSMQLLTLNF